MVDERQPIKDKVVAVLRRGDGTSETIIEKSTVQQLEELLPRLTIPELKTLLALAITRLTQ